jgi:nucleotide-binding universal stress UspA family protein
MISLLAYTDGKPASAAALHFAVSLKKRLSAQLAIITVRSGTHATEDPPPVGIEFPLTEKKQLPPGLLILADSMDILTQEALLVPPKFITIHDLPNGHMFKIRSATGDFISFHECFGHFIETLNREVDQHRYTLLIISPPRRSGLRRLMVGDTTRRLALDLHTSILVVRGGNPDSRFLICADGSASSRRQYPLLKVLLPAVRRPVELVWVKVPGSDPEHIRNAEECLRHASDWLETCGKSGPVNRLESENPADMILKTAGDNSVIVMGASLRHDVYRRMMGSLPMQVLSKTDSSVILVKLPPEGDLDSFKEPFSC